MPIVLARIVSYAVNPLFIVLWLVATALAWRRRPENMGRYVAASVGAVIFTYLVVHGFRWMKFWPAHPEFPSGHETLAASIGTSLTLLNVKWLVVALPLLALFAVGLVYAHYHDWLDIAGALAVSPLLTWLIHYLFAKKRQAARI